MRTTVVTITTCVFAFLGGTSFCEESEHFGVAEECRPVRTEQSHGKGPTLIDLRKIGEDTTRSEVDRIAAIMKIGKDGSSEAIDYLLQNICLTMPKGMISKDDDGFKYEPCFFALVKHGERVVSHVLRFIEAPREEKYLKQIARLFIMMGQHTAARKALLEKREQRKTAPSSEALLKNIDELLLHLPEPGK